MKVNDAMEDATLSSLHFETICSGNRKSLLNPLKKIGAHLSTSLKLMNRFLR